MIESNTKQIDELAKMGLAKVGSWGDIQFGNEWSTQKLNKWLQEILPAAFKHDLAPGEEYIWWLLKSHRSHLSFHCEFPDGIDLVSVKGGKSKGWQDSKIYFSELTFYIIYTWTIIYISSYLHTYSRGYT